MSATLARLTIAILGLVGAACTLAACAGDLDPPPATAPTQALAAIPSPSPTLEPTLAVTPWQSPPPGADVLVLDAGSATRGIPRTVQQIAATTQGIAVVRFLSLERTESPASTRRPATEEDVAEWGNHPLKKVEVGQMIGSHGIPRTVYRAHITWADGATEEAEVSLLGGYWIDAWVDVFAQPHPEPGRAYVMFLRGDPGSYAPIGPQFELEGGTLQPFFDNIGVGHEMLGATLPELAALFEGVQFGAEVRTP